MEILNQGKYCFKCAYWQIDPGALDTRHQIISEVTALELSDPEEKKLSLTLDRSRMYGKCKAVYIDPFGEEKPGTGYLLGTFGSSECSAEDPEGNILFQEVPLG